MQQKINRQVSVARLTPGKGETVRQERTSDLVTDRLGKPHSEQGQIDGEILERDGARVPSESKSALFRRPRGRPLEVTSNGHPR